MDWCVGGREFAGGVSDWERCGNGEVLPQRPRGRRERQRQDCHRSTETQRRPENTERGDGKFNSDCDQMKLAATTSTAKRRRGGDRGKLGRSKQRPYREYLESQRRSMAVPPRGTAATNSKATSSAKSPLCPPTSRQAPLGYSWVSSCSAWADGFFGMLMASLGGVPSGAARRYWTGQLTGKPRSRATANGQYG